MDWTPIKRQGDPDVLSTRLPDPDRVLLVIPLSDSPPPKWVRHFRAHWTEMRGRASGEPVPDVHRSRIEIPAKYDEVGGWKKEADKAIDNANDYYEKQVLPNKQAKAQQERQAEEEWQRRLKEARRQAKEE